MNYFSLFVFLFHTDKFINKITAKVLFISLMNIYFVNDNVCIYGLDESFWHEIPWGIFNSFKGFLSNFVCTALCKVGFEWMLYCKCLLPWTIFTTWATIRASEPWSRPFFDSTFCIAFEHSLNVFSLAWNNLLNLLASCKKF